MKIYKAVTELPESAGEYFSFYHGRAFPRNEQFVTITTQQLKDLLEELRFAWVKYKDRRSRIMGMSNVLKAGIKKYEQKRA